MLERFAIIAAFVMEWMVRKSAEGVVVGVIVGVLLGGGMCLKNHWLLKWS